MARSFDQDGALVRLSLSVYLELMTMLGAYREALVLVGGWAPDFILERCGREERFIAHAFVNVSEFIRALEE